MRPFKRVPFNIEVVTALQQLLARAEQGHLNFLAFVICEGVNGGHGEDGYVGDTGAFQSAYYGLHRCASRIMGTGNKNAAPPQNLEPPANLYKYQVDVEPMCHDFIAWLVTMKMKQAAEGVEGPTKICFVKNREGNPGMLDEAGRNEFYKSVCVPALQLFDCVQSQEAINGRTYPMYSYQEITAAADEGQAVPRIKVPDDVMAAVRADLAGIEPVVITLREHKQWEHRNSDLTAWLNFAEYLEAHGERVIFVRDYANADEDIHGFETMPAASRDLLVRAALYENAKCNMFVSNGCQTFALFGSRPWLMFVACHEREEYMCNRPQWWEDFHGIQKGGQFPWSLPTQRMVWEEDTYLTMVRAWEDLFPMLQQRAA